MSTANLVSLTLYYGVRRLRWDYSLGFLPARGDLLLLGLLLLGLLLLGLLLRN